MVWSVKTSTKISLGAQFVFGIISILGFIKPVSDANQILFVLLITDLVVQVVEFCFYLVFVFSSELKTWYRYLDWFVSTPVMLLSTAMLLEYFDTKDTTPIKFQGFIKTFPIEMVFIVILNELMLVCGLLVEFDKVEKFAGLQAGLYFFTATFTILYARFGLQTIEGIITIVFISFIWSLYGAAAYLPYKEKNIAYNALDIFSKNVYGAALGVYLFIVT